MQTFAYIFAIIFFLKLVYAIYMAYVNRNNEVVDDYEMTSNDYTGF